ncbi:hypothetical protein NFI96_018082, partial [Prochilodus magdalenae]
LSLISPSSLPLPSLSPPRLPPLHSLPPSLQTENSADLSVSVPEQFTGLLHGSSPVVDSRGGEEAFRLKSSQSSGTLTSATSTAPPPASSATMAAILTDPDPKAIYATVNKEPRDSPVRASASSVRTRPGDLKLARSLSKSDSDLLVSPPSEEEAGLGGRSESVSNCSAAKRRLEKSPSFTSEWDEVRAPPADLNAERAAFFEFVCMLTDRPVFIASSCSLFSIHLRSSTEPPPFMSHLSWSELEFRTHWAESRHKVTQRKSRISIGPRRPHSAHSIEKIMTLIGAGIDFSKEQESSAAGGVSRLLDQPVGDWLEHVGLPQYESKLLLNGFDDLRFMHKVSRQQCPVGSVLWAASSGLRPLGCVLWAAPCGLRPVGSVLWAASSGQRPVGSVLWAVSCDQRPVGSVLWAAPYGQRPMGCVLWPASCGPASCGQRPVGSVLWASVLWASVLLASVLLASVLWAAPCGQRPVGCALWAASCGQRPVINVLWAASCGQRPVGQCPVGQTVLWCQPFPVALESAAGQRPEGISPGSNVMEEQDLREIGITDASHRKKLLNAARNLPKVKALGCDGSTSLSSWLDSLGLTEYLHNFLTSGYRTLESVKNLWELEIVNVLKITLLGHRKRIIASLAERPYEEPPVKPPRLSQIRCPELMSQSSSPISHSDLYTHRSMDPLLPAGDSGRRKGGDSEYDLSVKSRPQEKYEERPPESRLTLRPPSLAAPYAPVQNWHHQPEKLIFESCGYEANYLGSMLIKELRGTESTQDACAKMRRSTEQMRKVPTIVLSITYKGVKFIDAANKNIIAEHEIRNISCAAQDPEDLCTFAYITKDLQTSHHYCHVFSTVDVNLTYEIILTLGQAFEVAYQLALQAQRNKQQQSSAGSEVIDTKSSRPVPKPRGSVRKSGVDSVDVDEAPSQSGAAWLLDPKDPKRTVSTNCTQKEVWECGGVEKEAKVWRRAAVFANPTRQTSRYGAVEVPDGEHPHTVPADGAVGVEVE